MIIDRASIIAQIEKSAKVMYDATEVGDYKTNNKEGKKLTNIFRMLEKNLDLAKGCIEEMYKSENVIVLTEAASYSLALEIDVDRAVRVLTEISTNHYYGIYSLNAEMILNVWKKEKSLSIYPK